MVTAWPAGGAMNGSPTRAGSNGWNCPLCRLPSSQKTEESFQRHIDALHKVDMDEIRQRSEAEYQSYYADLIRQAFLSGQVTHGRQLSSSSRGPVLPPFGGSPSQGSSALDFQRLTIAGRESTQSPGPGGLRMAPISSQDDVSRLSHPPRPSSSSRGGARLPLGRHHSPVHRQQRPMRPMPSHSDPDFRRYTLQNRPASRELYDPVDDESRESRRKAPAATGQPSSPRDLQRHQQQHQPLPQQHSQSSDQPRGMIDVSNTSKYPSMILQPESRGISQEQLATEVRVIYNELTAVEVKCIQLQKEQASSAEHGTILPNAWRGLISIHRQLLNFHHDFFLASQHPAAAQPLHRLAAKYNMPARMWKHGIHSFLELLRHQLPTSLEFMVSFIYMAYHMMTLLLETVSAFEDTWIECLGDLSRYRMAVEEHDPKDRETWSITARYWYNKAADRMPNVGRLYHHLAILSRPNALQQLFMYSRSLVSAEPFHNTRESIKTLFTPVLNDNASYLSKADNKVVRIAAAIFYHNSELLTSPIEDLADVLKSEVEHLGPKWRDNGVYISGSAVGSLFDFGNTTSTLLHAIQIGNHLSLRGSIPQNSDFLEAIQFPADVDAESEHSFEHSRSFFLAVVKVVLERESDKNVHPAAHVIFAFVLILVEHAELLREPRFTILQRFLIRQLLVKLPWDAICRFLNTVSKNEKFDPTRFEQREFLRPQEGDGVLPEDSQLRGMVWTQTYFPKDLFASVGLGEERPLEPASTAHSRAERILWIGHKLALIGCLKYNRDIQAWSENNDSSYINDTIDVPMSDDASITESTAAVADDSDPMEDVFKTGPAGGIDTQTQYPSLPLRTQPMSPLSTAWLTEKVQSQFTTVVIDLKIMLGNEVFPCLVHHSQRWKIVVPTPVWFKLVKLESQDPNAVEAINHVYDALEEKKCVHLLNPSGEDVTKKTIRPRAGNKLDAGTGMTTTADNTVTTTALGPITAVPSINPENNSNQYRLPTSDDTDDDVLVKIVRAASDLHKHDKSKPRVRLENSPKTRAEDKNNTQPATDNNVSMKDNNDQIESKQNDEKTNSESDGVEEITRNFESATLLTDDENLRHNADKFGVFVLASTAFMGLLREVRRKNSLNHNRQGSGQLSERGSQQRGVGGNGSGETQHEILSQSVSMA